MHQRHELLVLPLQGRTGIVALYPVPSPLQAAQYPRTALPSGLSTVPPSCTHPPRQVLSVLWLHPHTAVPRTVPAGRISSIPLRHVRNLYDDHAVRGRQPSCRFQEDGSNQTPSYKPQTPNTGGHTCPRACRISRLCCAKVLSVLLECPCQVYVFCVYISVACMGKAMMLGMMLGTDWTWQA